MFKQILLNIKNRFCFQDKQIGNYIIKNASIYKRIFAFCIDMIISFFIIILLFNITLPIDRFKELKLDKNEKFIEEFLSEDNNNKLILQKMFSIMFCTSLFYFFVSNLYLNSTIGQRFFKLRIISVQRKKINKYDLFNKSLFISCFIVMSNTHLLLLFFVVPLIVSNFKFTLIDIITNTNIIEVKKVRNIC